MSGHNANARANGNGRLAGVPRWMKTPFWISFCLGIFIGIMALIMVVVSGTISLYQHEKLITEADLVGSVEYTKFFVASAIGFLTAAWCWRRKWWYAALPLMVLGVFGLYGVVNYFGS